MKYKSEDKMKNTEYNIPELDIEETDQKCWYPGF